MRKHSSQSNGFMVEIQEGLGNNWETHYFPSFCEMLDWFEKDELVHALDPKLRQTAMSQIKKGTSFWTLGTPECKVNGYFVSAASVRYHFSAFN